MHLIYSRRVNLGALAVIPSRWYIPKHVSKTTGEKEKKTKRQKGENKKGADCKKRVSKADLGVVESVNYSSSYYCTIPTRVTPKWGNVCMVLGTL